MKNILVFKHMPCRNPGIFRELAAEYGIQFTEIDCYVGDVMPDLNDYNGL
jgi:hypothetical protein